MLVNSEIWETPGARPWDIEYLNHKRDCESGSGVFLLLRSPTIRIYLTLKLNRLL